MEAKGNDANNSGGYQQEDREDGAPAPKQRKRTHGWGESAGATLTGAPNGPEQRVTATPSGQGHQAQNFLDMWPVQSTQHQGQMAVNLQAEALNFSRQLQALSSTTSPLHSPPPSSQPPLNASIVAPVVPVTVAGTGTHSVNPQLIFGQLQPSSANGQTPVQVLPTLHGAPQTQQDIVQQLQYLVANRTAHTSVPILGAGPGSFVVPQVQQPDPNPSSASTLQLVLALSGLAGPQAPLPPTPEPLAQNTRISLEQLQQVAAVLAMNATGGQNPTVPLLVSMICVLLMNRSSTTAPPTNAPNAPQQQQIVTQALQQILQGGQPQSAQATDPVNLLLARVLGGNQGLPGAGTFQDTAWMAQALQAGIIPQNGHVISQGSDVGVNSDGQTNGQATQPNLEAEPAPPEERLTASLEPAAISMHMDSDAQQLSEYQSTVRRRLEFFVAQPEDVESNARGRKKQVHLGQVGIRCMHCAHLPLRRRGRGAVYYPAKLNGVYQAAQNMASSHLGECCLAMSEEMKQQLRDLRSRKDTATGGKQYWIDSCKVIGLFETIEGIFLSDTSSSATKEEEST